MLLEVFSKMTVDSELANRLSDHPVDDTKTTRTKNWTNQNGIGKIMLVKQMPVKATGSAVAGNGGTAISRRPLNRGIGILDSSNKCNKMVVKNLIGCPEA